MAHKESVLGFKIATAFFKVKYMFEKTEESLVEAGLKPGNKVLDYGCGPGFYTIPASKIVGENGKIYALDILSFAVQKVKKTSEKKGLKNIEII